MWETISLHRLHTLLGKPCLDQMTRDGEEGCVPSPRDVTLLWEQRVSLNGTEVVRRLKGSPLGLGAWL